MSDKTKTFSTRIKSKRDTSANWESANPVLLNGEKIIVDTAAGEVREKIGDGVKTYSQLPFTDEKIRGLITEKADEVELERLKYYGDKDIIPSDSSYFTVNETGETITGLTDTGKTQTELVIPYEINGVKITTLCSGSDGISGPPVSILNGNNTITKVVIPKSVTTLGGAAFYGRSSLASINIPNGVTSIENYAFVACRSLKSIDIPNSVTSIGDYTFNTCLSLTSINIPNSVTNIGNGAFANCTSLASINIPNSVTSIGNEAFEDCTSLTSIDIPNSVTSIRTEVFRRCTSLTSINIPNSVTSIGSYAFDGCSSLTSVNIPNSVTSIGNNAFAGCSSNFTIYCEQGSYAETYAKSKNIPIVYTDMKATSVVGEATSEGGEIFNDYDGNKAVSDYSHASGSNTIAGIKGYYYTMQSTTELTIYKNQARTTKAQVPTSWLNGRISLVNDNKYDNVATISSIGSDGSSIVITPELPFTSIVSVSNPNLDDYSIICLDAPLDGEIDFGLNAIAMGENSKALNRDSFTTGRDNEAIGQYSFVTGRNNTVGYGGFATGRDNKAEANYAHAGGYEVVALGNYSYAYGLYTKAIGYASHAEGNNTIASANGSHAEGINTTASGVVSHAEGYRAKANGGYAHAEGYDTKAIGYHSHAEGYNTEASGSPSHAEGESTIASANGSHAEGYSTKAQGASSHSEGTGTIANGENQHTQGKYNVKDTENKYAHIVGNGTSDTARSNAHTVDWNGNAWFAGDVEGAKDGVTHKLSEKANASDLSNKVSFGDNYNTSSAGASDVPITLHGIAEGVSNSNKPIGIKLNPGAGGGSTASITVGCDNSTDTATLSYDGLRINSTAQYSASNVSLSPLGLRMLNSSGSDMTQVKAGSVKCCTDGGNKWHELSEKAEAKTYTVSVPTTSWTEKTDTGNQKYYYKKITVSGMTASGQAMTDVAMSDSVATARQEMEAYQCVNRVVTGNGYVELYCFEEVPTTAFTLRILVISNILS